VIEAIVWPAAVVILGFGFMVMYRTPIRALLDRTKHVGRTGLETFEPPQLPAAPEKPDPLAEFLGTYDNPLLKQQEVVITADLTQRGLNDPQAAQRALVRSLAGTQILLAFEKIQGGIWASQVTLLTYLNSRTAPINLAEARTFYDAAAKQYPEMYEHYPFENWVGYLTSYTLVELQGDRVAISRVGREFLKWRLEEGKAGPFYG
jgi:hypothetical protein